MQRAAAELPPMTNLGPSGHVWELTEEEAAWQKCGTPGRLRASEWKPHYVGSVLHEVSLRCLVATGSDRLQRAQACVWSLQVAICRYHHTVTKAKAAIPRPCSACQCLTDAHVKVEICSVQLSIQQLTQPHAIYIMSKSDEHTTRPLQFQVLPAAVATGRVPDGLEDTEAPDYTLLYYTAIAIAGVLRVTSDILVCLQGKEYGNGK